MNAFRWKTCRSNQACSLAPWRGPEEGETYYYDIRKQVFEYDEVMNNQRRAVYSERRRVLDGRALKAVIGYGERTMSEIVEAYVNPDLPPENGILLSWWAGEGSSICSRTSP